MDVILQISLIKLCKCSSLFVNLVGKDVDLFAISSLQAKCGVDVKMPCEVSRNQLDIKYFAWEATNKTCKYGDPHSDSGYLCESEETPDHRLILTLTLLNVTPANKGDYFCKLRSKQAAKFEITTVEIRGKLTFNILSNLFCYWLFVFFLKVPDLYRLHRRFQRFHR